MKRGATFVAEQQLTTAHGCTLDGLQPTLSTQCLQMHHVTSSLSVDGIFPHKGGADESKQTGFVIIAVVVFLSVSLSGVWMDVVFRGVPLPPPPLSGYTFSNQPPGLSGSSCVKSVQLQVFTFGDGKYSSF